MAAQASNNNTRELPVAPLSVALLDKVAARFRAGGLFLVMLNRDATVVYHDTGASPFFLQFVLPLLRSAQVSGSAFSADCLGAVNAISAVSEAQTWSFIPGAVAAAFPVVDRRQVNGVLVLIGKSRHFELSDSILELCEQMGVDGLSLGQDASCLGSFDAEAVHAATRLLVNMSRDQLRLNNLERELDSLSTQLANSYEELSLIYQVSSGMKVNRGPAEFFKQACLDVREVVNVRGMGVILCGEGSSRQAPILYGDDTVPSEQVNRLANELMAVLRDRKSPLLINDLSSDKRFRWAAEHFRQIIAVPLQRQEQVLGCLFGIDKSHGEFDSVDSKLLNSIANESAIYLENAMLFEDVRDLMMGVLHSLTSAVDAKDAYTCGHSERVALLSRRLAHEIELPPQQIERIYMAGILHDVGKIGVPEGVLQKTGKLTSEEFEQMKRHPVIGARILQDIKQLADIIPGVLHHHERYDGKGYPHRLSGQRIPLMGRIICLADCFDAMTSNRTYRRALPLEVALIEMRRCAGTQFDPKLAEAFLRITPSEFRDLLREHQVQVKQRLDAGLPELGRAA